jgi:hypothetical protein
MPKVCINHYCWYFLFPKRKQRYMYVLYPASHDGKRANYNLFLGANLGVLYIQHVEWKK